MNVVVTLEHRFEQTPDGAVWTQTMFSYRFWERYLEVFDHVRVAARIHAVNSVPESWLRVDGGGLSFAAVPYYLGPRQFVRQARRVQRATRTAVGPDDAVILRVPSTVANTLAPHLAHTGHPFGVEVVADPYDGFAPGAISHPLRPFFRWWSPRQLRRWCAAAAATSYVTTSALQHRYPPALGAFTVPCSDVELPDSAIVPASRSPRPEPRPLGLIVVGSMAHRHKAIDVLIDAMRQCVDAGHDLRLTIVGDGKHRPELETQARHRGVADRTTFLGQLTAGAAVRAELDAADLFVLPSRQEGLPRAMIEAMARALPCIGAAVGGVPELLAPEDLVPSGDASALARKIMEVVSDPKRLAIMSARNLETAQDYREVVQHRARVAFYQQVRQVTEDWQIGSGRALPALPSDSRARSGLGMNQA